MWSRISPLHSITELGWNKLKGLFLCLSGAVVIIYGQCFMKIKFSKIYVL